MPDNARALPEHDSALPPGTRLGEFEIKNLLGVGGFGIVYLAVDHTLEREVAVKEYMPASMAGRTETLHVSIRSQGDAEVFALGLRSFVNEAKLLARFDHPSLIKVHRFWEANGTAYMAMPVLRGRSLKDIRKSTGRGPDEAWIRAVLTPLLGAREQLHHEGVYHRDIAPDNIHLEAEGRPVLLDFGAARRVISGKTQTLTAILKPAYAPIEQYAESAAVKQGPWTDLYALGAMLHYMLLGHPPAPATARTVADEASVLSTQAVAGVTPQLLAVIEWMLAPRPSERPQSVAELRAVLDGRAAAPKRAATPPPPVVWDKPAVSAPAVTIPLGEIEPTDIDLDMSAPPAPATRAPAEATRTRPRNQASEADSMAVDGDDAHRMPPPAPTRSRVLPLAVVGLVLVGAAGYFAWGKLGPVAAQGAALAASAAQGSPATVSAASAGASGAALAFAETASAATAAATPRVAEPASALAVPAASAVPTAAASAPEVAASAPSDVESVAAGGAAPELSGAAASGPARAGGPTAAGRPVAATSAPATAPPAAGSAESALGATPDARCSGRNSLSYFICMDRECLRPRFKNHPECKAWRQQARPRDASGN